MGPELAEVGPRHPSHRLLEDLRTGLTVSLTEGAAAPQLQLSSEDYTHREIHQVPPHTLLLTNHAPVVFATLRTAFGVGRKDFLSSVAPAPTVPYLRYLSNSSGKHDFYLSHDRRFVFKTESSESISFFLQMLEDYVGHFIRNPHSLIVKIFGVYSLQGQTNQSSSLSCSPSSSLNLAWL